ncbi:hypothetical protein HPG69_014725 [Diceros bicornis minor]|uniref:Uncharacterized protein n=1 Tax=Diceros bicornis minor TaxID=77932 RepID=A0A7J7EYF4_DICBM|nr:hypothetical protein HPG69_014725 [Diceros bicornis minor]
MTPVVLLETNKFGSPTINKKLFDNYDPSHLVGASLFSLKNRYTVSTNQLTNHEVLNQTPSLRSGIAKKRERGVSVTGLPTRSPGTSGDIRNPSSEELSSSQETRVTVGTSLRETPPETAPTTTMVGPATPLQSMATAGGSTRLPHLPIGAMVPAESSTEMVVAAKRISHSTFTAEAWAVTDSGTPEGTSQSRGTMFFLPQESTPIGATGNVQQVSSVLTPETTEMDLAHMAWLHWGTTVDTHVPLSTSSTGLQQADNKLQSPRLS